VSLEVTMLGCLQLLKRQKAPLSEVNWSLPDTRTVLLTRNMLPAPQNSLACGDV
jgi:hypothetical protein